MNKNYIPFRIDNFAEIQRSLQELYRDQFTGTSLKAFPKDWNRKNFLELYDMVDQFFKDNDATISSCRFFYTPPGQQLGVHSDGNNYDPNYWALNIPIFTADSMHWQEWFAYDGELKKASNGVYRDYVQPANPEKLIMIDRLILTAPHLLRVGIFHRVVNNSSESRLIVSIRFQTNSLDRLLTRIAETASNVSPKP
jgi:hypothetical protein